MFKVLMYSTEAYDKLSFRKESSNFPNIEITYSETQLNKNSVAMADGYDAICIFVNDDASKEVIELLPKSVKAIFLRCAGYNNVDLEACNERGIIVSRVPSYSPEAVAEHAATLMMSVNRRIHKAYNRVRDNNFSLTGLSGYCLHGKTVGIIGLGRIGVCFANICKGLGMNIIAYDPKVNGPVKNMEIGDNVTVEMTSLNDLFSRADVISLHVPLLDSTRHMINKETISMMKDGVILINVSRGGLIDTEALIEANKDGKFFGIGLDVYEGEEPNAFKNHENDIIMNCITSRLTSFYNVIVTSHQAFLTDVSLEQIAKTTYFNINAFANGDDVINKIIIDN